MIYLTIFGYGLALVGAVSWQTVNLQRGGPLRVWCGALVVALIWYQNVGIAADPTHWAQAPVPSSAGTWDAANTSYIPINRRTHSAVHVRAWLRLPRPCTHNR